MTVEELRQSRIAYHLLTMFINGEISGSEALAMAKAGGDTDAHNIATLIEREGFNLNDIHD